MKHSFAYGSTFYQSWLKVLDTPLMREAAAHARERGLLYGVLGASIGWHVFYGALSWDLPARGWEILCSQVDIARQQAERHLAGSAMAARVVFECQDALQADLARVHILVLAFSRDVNLGVVLNQKMADALAPGALVVAWSRILDAQPEFERAAVYKAPRPARLAAVPAAPEPLQAHARRHTSSHRARIAPGCGLVVAELGHVRVPPQVTGGTIRTFEALEFTC
jgi:hypothetical protein